MNITAASPVEIDAEIFRNLQLVWAAQDTQEHLLPQLHSLVGDKQVRTGGWGSRAVWQMSREQVLRTAQLAVEGRTFAAYRAWKDQGEIIEEARLAMGILNAEFTRRGGWTRAYLVDNADGHVHNTDACSSFRIGTRYHWLTELSGQAESEIVELAGERACTICFPTAPVDVLKRPSKLEGPAQIATREAKAARDAEKAVRDAKKAEKAIANPDGSPLQGKWGVIKTTVTAWNELVDDIFTSLYYGYELHAEINDRITAALMHKTGQSEAEILNALQAKVAAKAKREKISI